MSTVYPAPAKLNLFLHVVGRRPDGYHLLQSVFRLIELTDWLTFDVRADGIIRARHIIPGIDPGQDLCVRAAQLLQQESGCPRGADIYLDKHIPMGGGLGGGSSDAATTLMALNRLWGLHWPVARLLPLAERLGADVPFFIFGQNAFVEGIGEQLAPVTLADAWYIVLMPPVGVATAEIFSSPELTRDTDPVKMHDFPSGFGRNDLEPVAIRKYPVIGTYLAWLKQFGPARMTGSGACVFLEVATEVEAQRIWALKPADMRGVLARGLASHPMMV